MEETTRSYARTAQTRRAVKQQSSLIQPSGRQPTGGRSCRPNKGQGRRQTPRGKLLRKRWALGPPLGHSPVVPDVPVSQDEIERTQGFSYNRGTVGTPKVGTSGWDTSVSSSPACFRSSRAGPPRCSRPPSRIV